MNEHLNDPKKLSEGLVYTAENFTLPEDMIFGQAQVISIITYSILFIIGLAFNSISLFQLLMERIKKKVRNKMNLLLIHLAIADLVVSKNKNEIQDFWNGKVEHY